MRFELCRNCGEELKVHKKCRICRRPDEYICTNCGIIKNNQIHLKCIMTDMDYKLLKASEKAEK